MSIEQKIQTLKDAGWSTYYNVNYWVHPKTVQNKIIQDHTKYGMSLDDAYRFETTNAAPLPPRPDVVKILKELSCAEPKKVEVTNCTDCPCHSTLHASPEIIHCCEIEKTYDAEWAVIFSSCPLRTQPILITLKRD